MDLTEQWQALCEVIAAGRQQAWEEMVAALVKWIGATAGGIYQWQGDAEKAAAEGQWSALGFFGDLPLSLPQTVGESAEPIAHVAELDTAHTTVWAVRVPLEGTPAYLLVVALPSQSLSAAPETLLKAVGELLAELLVRGEAVKLYEIEPLARSFRVATLGELAAGIAHEINNPLQVILGNAELLLDFEPLSESAREKVQDILQAGERIREIAHLVTKFADARRTEEKELLDFNQVVAEAAQLVSYSLVREGVRVKMELSSSPAVWARRGDLEEIVVQLVRNAGESIAESGKGSTVTVRTKAQGQWVRLEVEDDGPGVPLPLRDRIFDPFVTTKAAIGGTGLGLAIVQNLVTAHGGRIWLEDVQAGGARFVVELPIEPKTLRQRETRKEGK